MIVVLQILGTLALSFGVGALVFALTDRIVNGDSKKKVIESMAKQLGFEIYWSLGKASFYSTDDGQIQKLFRMMKDLNDNQLELAKSIKSLHHEIKDTHEFAAEGFDKMLELFAKGMALKTMLDLVDKKPNKPAKKQTKKVTTKK